ncbi:MAG: hypothetical protein RQ885_03715 [Desulfurococcales archaeon]|nr:hypothetical protein [Desulfurococcales archaeon]
MLVMRTLSKIINPIGTSSDNITIDVIRFEKPLKWPPQKSIGLK